MMKGNDDNGLQTSTLKTNSAIILKFLHILNVLFVTHILKTQNTLFC